MKIRPEEQMIVNGRLTQAGVSFQIIKRQQRIRYAVFRCACGNVVVLNRNMVRTGNSSSCGCFRKEFRMSHGASYTKAYKAWMAMKERCNNQKSKLYKNYGQRGILVCDRWSTFENFYADMGDVPFCGAHLDRIDNNGNYEPGNCRWVTNKENSRNTRRNVVVEWEGKQTCIADLAERYGISYGVFRYRISVGWAVGDAIKTPVGKKRQ